MGWTRSVFPRTTLRYGSARESGIGSISSATSCRPATCRRGTTTSSGEVTSQTSIKERIKELVAQEDLAKPLSDDQLAALLEEKDGIRIARRTVTKYRKALGLPSSSQRRAY